MRQTLGYKFRIGNKVIRPATGVLTKDGIRPIGHPPIGDAPKKQVKLRLDADQIDRFRATGKGWQRGSTWRCVRRRGFNGAWRMGTLVF